MFASLRAAWDDRPCGYAATGLLPYSYPYGLGYVCETGCGNGVVEPGEGCDDSGPGCTATCQSVRPCTEAGGMASPVNGHCYFALSTPLAFSDALAACPNGTHLATLDEAAESEAAALAVGGSDAWIALTAAVTQGDYAWTNGGDVFESTRYHGFANPDPDGATAPPFTARASRRRRVGAIASARSSTCRSASANNRAATTTSRSFPTRERLGLEPGQLRPAARHRGWR